MWLGRVAATHHPKFAVPRHRGPVLDLMRDAFLTISIYQLKNRVFTFIKTIGLIWVLTIKRKVNPISIDLFGALWY